MKHVPSVLVLSVVLAGCGGSSPTAPTSPPPAPTPPPSPEFVATSEGVTFPFDGTYSFAAMNRGSGCGVRVRGSVGLLNGAGQVYAEDGWELPPERLIRPGEAFNVQGCCFTDEEVEQSVTVRLRFEADTVACQ